MKRSNLILFFLFVTSVFSQNNLDMADATVPATKSKLLIDEKSIITGTVIEESSGKTLPGVLVVIKGTNLSTITDSQGRFYFRKLDAGKYNLEFSFVSFSTKIVSDVDVVDKETTSLTVSLSELNGVLDEVVIKKTVKAKAESIQSLLTMQKNSVRVSDGISAESIKRTPDKTASDALRRISGASIQNNKFIVIRGLNDRYNTTYLNGSPLPSTEPDRKAFSFDIFPTNMLDNLVVNKTASPDLPGEFAGGVVEINTKMAPDKDFQTLSIGGGYNLVTTGKTQIKSNDAKAGLPSYFPSTAGFIELQMPPKPENNILALDNLSKKYQTDWGTTQDNFDLNNNFQLSLGRYFKFKEDKSLGLLASVTNNISNVYADRIQKFYEVPNSLLENFSDKSYTTQRLSGAILNLSLKMNANNKFSFKNLYSINSETRFTDRFGTKNVTDAEPTMIVSTNRFFSKNNIYTGQAIGEHFLAESKIKINWVGSFSNIKRDIPSERRNTYEYIKFSDGTQSAPKANFLAGVVGRDSPGSIFTSLNKEYIYSAKIDLSKKISFSDDFSADFKIGGITQSRNRKFAARQLGYVPFNGTVGGIRYETVLDAIAVLPNQTIFNSSSMGILSTSPKESGLTIFEGTKGSDTYDAQSNLDAGYLMIDNVFKKLRIVWGIRLENYHQSLNSKTIENKLINVDDKQFDVLPSVNFIYKLSKNQNIRVSGSKTLNRPEFRELAPFLFFDNETRFNTEGNPDLKITEIYNVDLRYEFFPGKGQLFSVSTFYKDFKNPIEVQALANNSNIYKNAKSGTDFGVELEFRSLLSTLTWTKDNKFLDDLTLYANLAVIRSKVDVSNLFVTPTNIEDIPMQGQSPFVLNAGIQYTNIEAGWSFSANLNRIGDRISIHANQTLGNPVAGFWEKARTLLDLQLAKTLLNKKLEFKINLQNALAQDLILYQNNYELAPKDSQVKGFKSFANKMILGDSQNKNGYDSTYDDLNAKINFGAVFSCTLTYTF
jgi:hypothetical protein